MGNTKALYACPKHFKYYRADEGRNRLYAPRGILGRANDICEKHGVRNYFEDRTVRPSLTNPIKSNITLRDYQYGIIKEINPEENNQGILKLSTGWGKTILAFKLIEELQTKTLIIANRQHIIAQFREGIESFLSCESGIIQGSKQDIKDVTVASLQTLQRKLGDLHDLGSHFGLVICDEAHGAVTEKSRTAIAHFRPKFLYGLSATPERTDGKTKAINFTFGDIIVDKKLETITPTVYTLPYHKTSMCWEYGELINSVVEDQKRNKLIADTAIKEMKQGRRVLILTKRVQHYETIYQEITSTQQDRPALSTLEVHTISARKKGDRQKIKALREGQEDYNCLLGTFSLLSTGVDIPSLDTLIIAGDLKSSVLTTQSCGRIMRLFKGKLPPKIIDVADKGSSVLYRQHKHRRKTYLNNNWEVKDYE